MKLFYVVLVILLFYNLGLTLYVFKINRRLKEFNQIIYHFFLIFLYLIKCPQSLILSALRAFLLSVHVRISGYIFLCFPSQTW